ncbi:MAG: hypothetical protein ABIH78_04555 [Candidatus Peregrinibacteria bacterium]
MKTNQNKIWRNIAMTFGTAILTILVVYGGYGIFAQDTEYLGEFSVVQLDYHANMNGYFNSKIEHLVDLIDVDKNDFYKNPDFEAPEKASDCGENNVSTYCVAVGAADLYIEYLGALNGLKGFLPPLSGEISTQEEAAQGVSIRDEEIAKESTDAKLAMKATISAYDSFKTAYPMHIKYETIITNVTKYKLALKRIRNRVERFPMKFIDATSSECK